MSANTSYLLYFVFTLGAGAIFFLMPRGSRSRTQAGAVLGVSALAALLVLFVSRVAGPNESTGFFCLFSAMAIAAAARVITHPKPVYSALYFVVVVVAVAALLVLQEAEFLAIALLIVYAGAILVTYLFVIMLAQQPGVQPHDRYAREPLMAVLCGFVLMAAVAGRAGELSDRTLPITVPVNQPAVVDTNLPPSAGNTYAIGALVMTKYVVAMEIAGVLLLVAMVGAVALSRKKVPQDGTQLPPRPLGQVGKEAAPF